jgi:hypothetical protein
MAFPTGRSWRLVWLVLFGTVLGLLSASVYTWIDRHGDQPLQAQVVTAPVDAAPPTGVLPVTPVAPAGPAVQSESFPPVRAEQPRLKVDNAQGADLLARVREVEGVSAASLVEVAEMPVAGAGGPTTIRMAAVNPVDYRLLTPQVTADAVGVWERLVQGEAAFTHDAGHRLEVPLGAEVPAAGQGTVRIGAYAANGIPPIADAIVSEETGRRLGLQGEPELLIALNEGADTARVARQIAAIAGTRPVVLEAPQSRRAFITGADARNAFEPYTYIDLGDGTIQIDGDWVRRNIVRARVPIFRGEVICHRLMIDQLRGALQEVADRGLASLIDVNDYGGCWVPRHIDWDPSKPLSMHSWGLAVDFNVATNGLGQRPTMDPRIVEIFERWGFVWGGRWARPDGMHFELGALLNSPQG